jgi:hypothetical protein
MGDRSIGSNSVGCLAHGRNRKATLYDVLPTAHPKDKPTIPATIGLEPSLQNQLAADPKWVAEQKSEEGLR